MKNLAPVLFALSGIINVGTYAMSGEVGYLAFAVVWICLSIISWKRK